MIVPLGRGEQRHAVRRRRPRTPRRARFRAVAATSWSSLSSPTVRCGQRRRRGERRRGARPCARGRTSRCPRRGRRRCPCGGSLAASSRSARESSSDAIVITADGVAWTIWTRPTRYASKREMLPAATRGPRRSRRSFQVLDAVQERDDDGVLDGRPAPRARAPPRADAAFTVTRSTRTGRSSSSLTSGRTTDRLPALDLERRSPRARPIPTMSGRGMQIVCTPPSSRWTASASSTAPASTDGLHQRPPTGTAVARPFTRERDRRSG